MKCTLSFSERADVRELAAILAYAIERGLLDPDLKGDTPHPKRVSLAAIARIARASAVAAIPGHAARFASPATAWAFLGHYGLAPRQDPTIDRLEAAAAIIPELPQLVDYKRQPQAMVVLPPLESA